VEEVRWRIAIRNFEEDLRGESLGKTLEKLNPQEEKLEGVKSGRLRY
jgi:hypothetical protein